MKASAVEMYREMNMSYKSTIKVLAKFLTICLLISSILLTTIAPSFAQSKNLIALINAADQLREDGEYASALPLYLDAAEAGNTEAMNAYGVMIMQGLGARENLGKGYAWVKKAADAGYAPAQNNLSTFYAEGIWVRRNADQSEYWKNLALENGYSESTNTTDQNQNSDEMPIFNLELKNIFLDTEIDISRIRKFGDLYQCNFNHKRQQNPSDCHSVYFSYEENRKNIDAFLHLGGNKIFLLLQNRLVFSPISWDFDRDILELSILENGANITWDVNDPYNQIIRYNGMPLNILRADWDNAEKIHVINQRRNAIFSGEKQKFEQELAAVLLKDKIEAAEKFIYGALDSLSESEITELNEKMVEAGIYSGPVDPKIENDLVEYILEYIEQFEANPNIFLPGDLETARTLLNEIINQSAVVALAETSIDLGMAGEADSMVGSDSSKREDNVDSIVTYDDVMNMPGVTWGPWGRNRNLNRAICGAIHLNLVVYEVSLDGIGMDTAKFAAIYEDLAAQSRSQVTNLEAIEIMEAAFAFGAELEMAASSDDPRSLIQFLTRMAIADDCKNVGAPTPISIWGIDLPSLVRVLQ